MISSASEFSAAPWLRTIFRKKKSWPWIAVVPSYRVSILASRMYCSIGYSCRKPEPPKVCSDCASCS